MGNGRARTAVSARLGATAPKPKHHSRKHHHKK
jgi:hypothetical protein